MTKIIERMEIDYCNECPYCVYDSYYSKQQDSGYDCSNYENERIINDWDWNNPNNKNRLNLSHKGIPIPDWCPLKDIKEIRKNKLDSIKKG